MENRAKISEESSRALRWAECAQIMESADTDSAVTRGELAQILHRTLEYFFDRLIAVLEEC